MGTTCVKECVEPKKIVYLNTCLENCPLAATVRIGDKCFNLLRIVLDAKEL